MTYLLEFPRILRTGKKMHIDKYIDFDKEIDFKKIPISAKTIRKIAIKHEYKKIELQKNYWKSKINNLFLRSSYNLLPNEIKELIKKGYSKFIKKHKITYYYYDENGVTVEGICDSYLPDQHSEDYENFDTIILQDKLKKLCKKLEKVKIDKKNVKIKFKEIRKILSTPNTIRNLITIDEIVVAGVIDCIENTNYNDDFCTEKRPENYYHLMALLGIDTPILLGEHHKPTNTTISSMIKYWANYNRD